MNKFREAKFWDVTGEAFPEFGCQWWKGEVRVPGSRSRPQPDARVPRLLRRDRGLLVGGGHGVAAQVGPQDDAEGREKCISCPRYRTCIFNKRPDPGRQPNYRVPGLLWGDLGLPAGRWPWDSCTGGSPGRRRREGEVHFFVQARLAPRLLTLMECRNFIFLTGGLYRTKHRTIT